MSCRGSPDGALGGTPHAPKQPPSLGERSELQNFFCACGGPPHVFRLRPASSKPFFPFHALSMTQQNEAAVVERRAVVVVAAAAHLGGQPRTLTLTLVSSPARASPPLPHLLLPSAARYQFDAAEAVRRDLVPCSFVVFEHCH